MKMKPRQESGSQSAPDTLLAPITRLASSKLMVVANLLKRGAILRYKRLAGLSSVEFGLVAVMGRRPPVTIARLAELVGRDKGQISRALSGLVARRLVSRSVNPADCREVLVALTKTGLSAHDLIVAAGEDRNAHLLEGLTAAEIATLLDVLEHLTRRAIEMLHAEQPPDRS